MGVRGQAPVVGSIASAGARRDRHGQGAPTSRWSRCEHQLARGCWDRFRCFVPTGLRNGRGREATFQRFAAWLRRAGYVSTFSRRCGCGRDRRAVGGDADRLLRVRELRSRCGRRSIRNSSTPREAARSPLHWNQTRASLSSRPADGPGLYGCRPRSSAARSSSYSIRSPCFARSPFSLFRYENSNASCSPICGTQTHCITRGAARSYDVYFRGGARNLSQANARLRRVATRFRRDR
jgi:hypothetical protein